MVVIKTASRQPGKRKVAKTATGRTASVPESTEVPPIVGVGASAGGQEAFTQLLLALPPDPGMAFVLVQHLPPQRESILAKLLSSATAMPVIEVKERMPVRPNQVYVIGPNTDLTLKRACYIRQPVGLPTAGTGPSTTSSSPSQRIREREPSA